MDTDALRIDDGSCASTAEAASAAAAPLDPPTGQEGTPAEEVEVPVDYGRLAAYRQAMHALVDEDLAAFEAAVRSDPAAVAECCETPLLHYIYAFLGGPLLADAVAVYARAGGAMGIRSADFVTSMRRGVALGICLVGGQTILHVCARRSSWAPDAFAALAAQHPELKVPDFNGRLPSYYFERRGRWSPAEHSAELRAVKQRYVPASVDVSAATATPVTILRGEALVPPHRPLQMLGVTCFRVDTALVQRLRGMIATLPATLPNSMHRTGKVLLPSLAADVYGLVKSLLLIPAAAAQQRITHIHAFSVQYAATGANRSLGPHRDDSTFTVNLCLAMRSTDSGFGAEEEVEEEAAAALAGGPGGDLQFDATALTEPLLYRHTAGYGILHPGALVHRVLPSVQGQRENVIIWVTLADDNQR